MLDYVVRPGLVGLDVRQWGQGVVRRPFIQSTSDRDFWCLNWQSSSITETLTSFSDNSSRIFCTSLLLRLEVFHFLVNLWSSFQRLQTCLSETVSLAKVVHRKRTRVLLTQERHRVYHKTRETFIHIRNRVNLEWRWDPSYLMDSNREKIFSNLFTVPTLNLGPPEVSDEWVNYRVCQ